jgi:hypothetical protein
MRAHDAPPVTAPRPPEAFDPLRWLWAVDALAPWLILTVALTIAQQDRGAPARVGALLIGCTVVLGLGTAIPFFRDMSEAHITWPVTLAFITVLLPLIALHMQIERSAVNAPVPVHLLTVAFTLTALFVAACTVIGIVLTTAALTPQWAGVTVAPVALLLGWLPVLALRTTPDDLFTVAIFVAVIAGVAAGIAWLLPERRRWFVIPVMLVIGAAMAWQRFTATPHHLPGRWLFLADAGLALFVGAMALAAPPLCRWLHGHSAAGIVRSSLPAPLHRPQALDTER